MGSVHGCRDLYVMAIVKRHMTSTGDFELAKCAAKVGFLCN